MTDISKLGVYTICAFREVGYNPLNPTAGLPDVLVYHVIADSPSSAKTMILDYLKDHKDIDFLKFNNMHHPRPITEPIAVGREDINPAQYNLIKECAKRDRVIFYPKAK
jgi:hypothetical protein